MAEWVYSLEDAYDTLWNSGAGDTCQDQLEFELGCADLEVKTRLIEMLSNIDLPKLHEMLAELEPLTCKGLKEND